MAAANLLSASAARRHGAVPVAYIDKNTLLLAMSDPANVLAVDDIVLLTRLDVRPRWPRQDIAALVTRLNRFEDAVQEAVQEGEDDAAPVEIVDLRESADDAPVIKLVHSIIAQAAERRASDLHFEPQPDPSSRVGGSAAGARPHRGEPLSHRRHVGVQPGRGGDAGRLRAPRVDAGRRSDRPAPDGSPVRPVPREPGPGVLGGGDPLHAMRPELFPGVAQRVGAHPAHHASALDLGDREHRTRS
jgi:hypothetical protein